MRTKVMNRAGDPSRKQNENEEDKPHHTYEHDVAHGALGPQQVEEGLDKADGRIESFSKPLEAV